MTRHKEIINYVKIIKHLISKTNPLIKHVGRIMAFNSYNQFIWLKSNCPTII